MIGKIALISVIAGVGIISFRAFVLKRKLYWFSATDGQVLNQGVPVGNATIFRISESSLFGSHTDTTTTDATGYFTFPALVKSSPRWKVAVAPLTHGGINQRIEIEYQGQTYLAWSYFQSLYTEPNKELNGKPITLVCELTAPERVTRIDGIHSAYGMGDVDSEYDQAYSSMEARLEDQKAPLLEASRQLLLQPESLQRQLQEIQNDGVVNVTDLQFENLRDLHISDFSLTEAADEVDFYQGFYFQADLILHTTDQGEIRHTNTGVVTQARYDLKKHTLTPIGTSEEGLYFHFELYTLYDKQLKKLIKPALLEEGITTLLNTPRELSYRPGVEAIKKAGGEVTQVEIHTVEPGAVQRRNYGVFTGLRIQGEAQVVKRNKPRTIPFEIIVLVAVSSLHQPPYQYIDHQHEHLWEKGNNGYIKVPIDE